MFSPKLCALGGNCGVLGMSSFAPWPSDHFALLPAAYRVRGMPQHRPDYSGINIDGLESPQKTQQWAKVLLPGLTT